MGRILLREERKGVRMVNCLHTEVLSLESIACKKKQVSKMNMSIDCVCQIIKFQVFLS